MALGIVMSSSLKSILPTQVIPLRMNVETIVSGFSVPHLGLSRCVFNGTSNLEVGRMMDKLFYDLGDCNEFADKKKHPSDSGFSTEWM